MPDSQPPKSKRAARHTNLRSHSENFAHDAIPDIKPQRRKVSADYSKPVLPKTIVIHTNQVQQAFEHVYIRVDYRYLSRYFKKIYEELFAPLKVSAGALPLRFATPGYFSNVNRLISV